MPTTPAAARPNLPGEVVRQEKKPARTPAGGLFSAVYGSTLRVTLNTCREDAHPIECIGALNDRLIRHLVPPWAEASRISASETRASHPLHVITIISAYALVGRTPSHYAQSQSQLEPRSGHTTRSTAMQNQLRFARSRHTLWARSATLLGLSCPALLRNSSVMLSSVSRQQAPLWG
jgi:hypothetical protein